MSAKKSDKHNTLHHFIQKAYLDNFAENDQIDVIKRSDGTVRTGQLTENVAVIRGLYTITNEDGERDGRLEDAFSVDLEEPAMKIINNMTCVFPYVPEKEERSLIAHYMGFQYLRTLEGKRKFEADAGMLVSIQLFNFANNNNEIKKRLSKRGIIPSDDNVAKHQKMIFDSIKKFEIVPNNNPWLLYIYEGIQQIAPLLYERYRWHLFIYDQPTFITSDHPVVLRRIHNDYQGVGFANADEVMFPLTNHHALFLSTDNSIPEGIILNPSARTAEMINHFIVQESYLEMYSPPSLTNQFSGRALGRRPITTMSGPDIPELEFLKKYSGVLDRDYPKRS